MPTYDYRCDKCDKVLEIRHSIHETESQLCKDCGTVMVKVIGLPMYVIMKEGGYLDHKEREHQKKVKDPERAVKMRKKAFGKDAVGDPSMKNADRHIIKGRTLGGQQKEVDKKDFVKAAARDDLTVQKCINALKKENKKP